MTDKHASNIYIMLPLRAPHNLKKNLWQEDMRVAVKLFIYIMIQPTRYS